MPYIALIPAYKPPPTLIGFITDLIRSGFGRVIVVDDGSGDRCRATFNDLSALSGVTVLTHAVNLGKGAALKTGINHICVAYPDAVGVVTVDADGQHSITDALRVAQSLAENPDNMVIGVRHFDGTVPLRSRFGNSVTRQLFKLLIGYPLRDTQSGLRGIPRKLALRLLSVRSQRYEFELDMLLMCRQTGTNIRQISIDTIYMDGNSSSSFNPILDSVKIYFSLLRFTVTSILTALIDNIVFVIMIGYGWPIISSQVASRTAGAGWSYIMVRNFVFLSREEHKCALPKFLVTVAVLGSVSYGMIIFLSDVIELPVILSKLLVETVLYLGNFLIQRDFVFRHSEP